MTAPATDRVLVGVEASYDKQSATAPCLFVSELRELAVRELPTGNPDLLIFEVADLGPFAARLIAERVWFSVEGSYAPEGSPIAQGVPWLRVLQESRQGDGVRVVLEVAGNTSWHLLSADDWKDVVETAQAHGGVSALLLLQESVLDQKRPLEEVWGKNPRWLKVTNIKTGYSRSPAEPGKVTSEVTVRIRGKDYWFPADPSAVKKFVQLGKTKNRGNALTWFRRYVRREKRYKGRWPDRGYVIGNKVLKKNTIKDEPTRIEGLANREQLDTFHEDMDTTLTRQLVDLTGLSARVLCEAVHRLRGGESLSAVADRLSLEGSVLEGAVDCMRALNLLDEVRA